jgi:hypothetical protein
MEGRVYYIIVKRDAKVSGGTDVIEDGGGTDVIEDSGGTDVIGGGG